MQGGDGPDDLARQEAVLARWAADVESDEGWPEEDAAVHGPPLTDAELARVAALGAPVYVTHMRARRFNNHLGTVIFGDPPSSALCVDGRVRLQLHTADGGKKIEVPRDRIRRSGLPALPAAPSSSWTSPPVMTLDAPCTSAALVALLGGGQTGLPDHLVTEHIVPFFTVARVTPSAVRCIRASSTRGDYPLGSVCNDNDAEWWISSTSAGRFTEGAGREWLEFDLSGGDVPCRVSAIGVKIPPMPHGPLSVRRFFVEYTAGSRGGHAVSTCTGLLETLDRPQLQRFALTPPIEATKVRVVMTLTAMGKFLHEDGPVAATEGSLLQAAHLAQMRASGTGGCVGLFGVKFW
jgi:hypothetical protein